MTGTTLVAYGTRHGSTREVAESVAGTLRELGLEVDVLEAGRVPDLSPFGGVVLGGALYLGRWHPAALGFLERHRHALAVRPVAVFAMGPRTLDPSEVEASRAQLGRALAKVPDVDPYAVAVFGGVVDPGSLRFPLSRMPASDARDWDAIEAWATEIAPVLDFGKAASETRDRRTALPQAPR